MLAVVYGLTVDKAVPPADTLNQATEVAPTGSVALNTTVPVPHLETSFVVGNAGTKFTVAITATLVADTHPVVVFLLCA